MSENFHGTSHINSQPLVSIICIAYNQARYVGQTLQGILAQETDFPFEVIINDDASQDGTADVIRSFEADFGTRMHPLYQQKNGWSQGIHPWFDVTFPLAQGKYIALCEGDDYWCDPKKLQKQIDFLEAHPDHGAIHSDYLELHEESGIYLHRQRESFVKDGEIFRDMLLANTNYLVTGSLVMRTCLVREATQAIRTMPKFAMGDLPLVLYVASRSKISYLNEVTCVYRILHESASHSANIEKIVDFRKSTLDVIETFANPLPDSQAIIEHARRFYYTSLLSMCLRHPSILRKFAPDLDSWKFSKKDQWKRLLCKLLEGHRLADTLAFFLVWKDAFKEKQRRKRQLHCAPNHTIQNSIPGITEG